MDNEAPYDGSLYRAFYVFMDPEKDIAEVPKTFLVWFGNRVSCTVSFKDSSHNIFNIRLTKAKGRWAFTDEIELLMIHYNLLRGAWVRIFYMGGNEFHVQLMNRDLVPVKDNHMWHHHYQFGWRHGEREVDPYDSVVRLGIRRGDPSVIHTRVIRNPIGGKFRIEKKSSVKAVGDSAVKGKSGMNEVQGAVVNDIKVEQV